jgi:hypothetical protein
MALLDKGLLGAASGAIGNIEVYTIEGRIIARSRRGKRTKPFSEKQLASQQRMRIVNQFLGAFIPFEREGFTHARKGTKFTAHNAATSWQLLNAIKGAYPNYEIDYPAARVTQGSMPTEGINPTAILSGDKLVFTWKPKFTYAHSNDNVMLLAYAPSINEAVYKIRGEKRCTGIDELILSGNYWQPGTEIHTYLSFMEENGKKCTNSIYVGKYILA